MPYVEVTANQHQLNTTILVGQTISVTDEGKQQHLRVDTN